MLAILANGENCVEQTLDLVAYIYIYAKFVKLMLTGVMHQYPRTYISKTEEALIFILAPENCSMYNGLANLK